jgi:signal peptidase II
MQKKYIKLILIVISLIAIDLISKYFFYDLQIGQNLSLLNPSFNTGIARSLPVPMIVTIILSIITAGLFILFFYRKQLSLAITSLLVAGTLGNLVDRILLGGVRDFFDIHLFNFPIFNVADVLLNI